MVKLLTIAANTFRETLRQPIFYVLLLATFGVLVLDVALSEYTFESGDAKTGTDRLLVELGVSTLLVTGLFISAFAASGSLAREIEARTVLTVVSKPVSRAVVLVGKFLGVLAGASVAYYLAATVFLWTVRHGTMPTATDPYDTVVLAFGLGAFGLAMAGAAFCNYFFGWQFIGTSVTMMLALFTAASVGIAFIGKGWQVIPFGYGIDPDLVFVIGLLWLAVVVLTALAVAVSTRLGQLATLAVCAGLFMLALVSDSFFRPHVEGNALARLAYWVMPNLNEFFAQDALMRSDINLTRQGGYFLLAGVYAVCYSAAMLLIGIALFQTREMDARASASGAPALVNALAWVMRGAAAVAGLWGLAVLAGQADRTAQISALLAVMAAVAGWLLAGFLGAGVRWAFWLLLFLAASQWVFSGICLILLGRGLPPDLRIPIFAASTLLALYVGLMAARRATRDHFAARHRRTAL